MKQLLILLMLLPMFAIAQTEGTKPLTLQNEVLISTGIGFNPDISFREMNDATVRTALGFTRKKGKYQYGLQLEMGADLSTYTYYAPVLIFNRIFTIKRSYLYAGTAAGYYHANGNMFREYNGLSYDNRNGYTFGLQVGGTFYISRHFAFTTEIATRSTQVWVTGYEFVTPYNTESYYLGHTEGEILLSAPVTLGFKYRF